MTSEEVNTFDTDENQINILYHVICI